MPQPALRDAAVGTFVIGQLTHHARLCPCMREHVDEVDDHHVKIVAQELVEASQQSLHRLRVVDFMIAEGVVSAIALDLRRNELLLIKVLSFFFAFIDPKVWEHFLDFIGHQPAEDGIAGILRGRGQNAHVELLFDVETVGKFVGKHAPLVVSEVIYHD